MVMVPISLAYLLKIILVTTVLFTAYSIPKLFGCQPGSSLLGLGDVVLPGLLLKMETYPTTLLRRQKAILIKWYMLWTARNGPTLQTPVTVNPKTRKFSSNQVPTVVEHVHTCENQTLGSIINPLSFTQ